MPINVYIPEGFKSTVFRVICTYEPRGDHGLEGFLLNDEYQAEIDRKGTVTLFTKDLADEWQPVGRVGKGVAAKYFDEVRGEVQRA